MRPLTWTLKEVNLNLRKLSYLLKAVQDKRLKNVGMLITYTVPDIQLWLGVLKHRVPLGNGAHLPAKQFFFLLLFCGKS
jgi:hypothetical protein